MTNTIQELRERSVLRFLAFCRRAFANTRLNRWAISGAIKRGVVRFGLGSAERTVDFHGAKLIVQLDDVASTPAILAGSYERCSLLLFQQLASRANVVLDVGSGQGMYAVVAGKAMSARGTILCFEPVPENQELIRRNIELNELEGAVVVCPQALSDTTGRATIHLASGNKGGHSLSPGVTKSEHSIQVLRETVDHVVTERHLTTVDLMKIDVEGFEASVIAGARSTISKHRPALLFELVPEITLGAGRDPSEAGELLQEFYEHFYLIDEVANSMTRVAPRDLVAAASGRASVNVVAVSRPEHVELADAAASKSLRRVTA